MGRFRSCTRWAWLGVALLSAGMPGTTRADSTGEWNPRWSVGGVLMWDYDRFDGVHTRESSGWENESELRRARLALKAYVAKKWRVKLQVTFDDSESAVEVDDAYLRYSGWSFAALQLGQMKEPFGLEASTSSKEIPFIERSMATNAFAPGRQPGIALMGEMGSATWALGVFEATTDPEGPDTYAVTGRITAAPLHREDHVLHIGASGSVRDWRGTYRIDETAEVHSAREFVDSPEIDAEQVRLAGGEVAWAWRALAVQAEGFAANVKAADGGGARFTGGYVQGGWFVTGESRPYESGVFGGIVPKRAWGALELVARYGEVDLRDDGEGVAASSVGVGANYYPNESVKVMLNGLWAKRLDGDGSEVETGSAISLRLQVVF